MPRTLFGIPRALSGKVTVAFSTFFAVLAGHSILETARDTLFLSALPADRLPWVYLAIAVLAFGAARLGRASGARRSSRAALSATLLVSAAVTTCFWFTTGRGTASLYAFYVWTGLVASVAVVQLWILVGDELDGREAKRSFALIGAGGLIGATCGSAMSSAALEVLGLAPRHLILMGSSVLALAGLLPILVWRPAARPVGRRLRRQRPPEQDGLLRHPYLRRLLVVVILTQLIVTGGDILFKKAVAASLPAEQLGSFFSIFYTGLNGVSLVVQLFVAGWLLQHLGVNRALWTLPLAIGAAIVAFGLTGALAPVLLAKIFDGSLRHSLHKTGIELLYVPVPSRLRDRAKVVIDAAAARGGQAAAAIAMVTAVSLGASAAQLAFGLACLVAALLVAVALIKAPYIDLFRRQLTDGTIETRAALPGLDLHSLEALVAGMASTDDAVTLAALDLLAASGRARLVSPLILHHPSREVVLRALAIMGESRRQDFFPLCRRLLGSGDPEVRCAALRALSATDVGVDVVRPLLEDPSPSVQATAVVALLARSADESAVRDKLRSIMTSRGAEARVALARAIRYRPGPAFHPVVRELAARPEPAVWAELARTIAAAPDPAFLPDLIPMLTDRHARPEARVALCAIGQPALVALERALADRSTPYPLRLHIPRTVSKFGGQAALDILFRYLESELDSVVGYKILRGMGRMVADDSRLRLDRPRIDRLLDTALDRLLTLAEWRSVLGRRRSRSAAAVLLADLLRDKEIAGLERVFRILGLRDPDEDFHAIYAGLRSSDSRMASSSCELLEYLIEPRTRVIIRALADPDRPLGSRLLHRSPPLHREPLSWGEVVRVMADDHSEVLAALARQVLAESEVPAGPADEHPPTTNLPAADGKELSRA